MCMEGCGGGFCPKIMDDLIPAMKEKAGSVGSALEFLVKQSRAQGLWGSQSRVLWALWKTRGMRRGEKSCLG